MATPLPSPLQLCPSCKGSGQGDAVPRPRIAGVIFGATPPGGDKPECRQCHGDGLIWVGHRQHP